MNPRIKKWIIRPLVILLVVIIAVGACGVLILSTQQDKLVRLAVKEVNMRLKGELAIDESSISLFKHFPYVSIALHNARLYAHKGSSEKPLFSVERIYAGFSIPDLIDGRHTVRRLIVKNRYIDLVRDTAGNVNIVEAATFKTDTLHKKTETTSTADVNLEKIVLKDISILFHDYASGMRYATYLTKVTSSFEIDSLQILGTLSSEMKLDIRTDNDTAFLHDKNVSLHLAAGYEPKKGKFKIATCSFNVDEAGFKIEGGADLSGEPDLNLRIHGDQQDFNLVTGFLPADVKQKMKPFTYDGRIFFDARVKGKVAENQMPLIEVAFGCDSAWIHNTSANKKVDQLGFNGFFTNGAERSLKTSQVQIINLSARPDKGVFKGNFVVRDFTKPRTLVQIRSELELNFIGEFFGIHDLKQMTGKIKLDMDFKELDDITVPEKSLNKLKEGIQSRLSVENLSFRIPGYPRAVRDMNLHAHMENGRVTIDSATLRIGDSDIALDGSLSDIRAFLRHHHKPITLALNAKSTRLILSELLSYDTALSNNTKEEITDFSIGLALETSVHELLNPAPLPKGNLQLTNLNGAFKVYRHKLKDLSATVVINDTLLRLRNLVGHIDSSDFHFSGRVINYQLWFDEIKKGKTQIAFDFKSKHFAIRDVLPWHVRKYLPRGYRRERIDNAWVRTKIDMRYDTIFRFAKAKIANITGDLVDHKLKLEGISGGLKYGARVLILDTLRGKIGRTDFDLTFKYFTGLDRQMRKRTNYLKFTSNFFDADEMSQYDLAPKKGRRRKPGDTTTVVATIDSTRHAEAFNIFIIPFSDFNAEIDIAKIKYNRLWLKDVTARLRMQEDQHIFVDTLRLKVAKGTIAMRGHFNGTDPDKIWFKSRIQVDTVDLEKMMFKLDHLGQDVVINKNIKGRLSGLIRSYVQVHPNLVPIMSKTKAELNISIYDGTLVDFAPMQAMASYFKDKNLRLIRFDTLQNKLMFTNGVLDIPSMDINSSLGYIQMSGKQSLDLNMEYYVRVPMKMVTKVGFSTLFSRKQEDVDLTQVDEIEYIDKEKKIAFMNLKVSGTPDDFTVGLGKDKMRR
ncbi:MAG TPA: AsmA-like C-terminal region-containing protein [Chryseosolibacter sp.]|nr:AsmA-like C-terminal region-containing protein [Chryseosolibacter sp.]